MGIREQKLIILLFNDNFGSWYYRKSIKADI